MFDAVMPFFIEFELTVYGLSFFGGTLLTLFVWKRAIGRRSWRIVDLVWISIGSLSTGAAVLATAALGTATEVQRNSERLRNDVITINSEANTMKSLYCSRNQGQMLPNARESLNALCAFVNSVVFDTAENSELRSVLEWVLVEFGKETKDELNHIERSGAIYKLQDFDDSEPHLSEIGNLKNLPLFSLKVGPDIIRNNIDLLLEASGYDLFIFELTDLRGKFERLTEKVEAFVPNIAVAKSRVYYLFARIMALMLLVFVVPLRIGKSIHDIKFA